MVMWLIIGQWKCCKMVTWKRLNCHTLMLWHLALTKGFIHSHKKTIRHYKYSGDPNSGYSNNRTIWMPYKPYFGFWMLLASKIMKKNWISDASRQQNLSVLKEQFFGCFCIKKWTNWQIAETFTIWILNMFGIQFFI